MPLLAKRRRLLAITYCVIFAVGFMVYFDWIYALFGVGIAGKWHIANPSTILCGRAKIEVPLLWWRLSAPEGTIDLTRAPKFGDQFIGIISIRGATIDTMDVKLWPQKREVNGQIIELKGDLQTIEFGDRPTVQAIYEVTSPKQKRGNLFGTILIPDAGIEIHIIDLEPSYWEIWQAEIGKKIDFF